MGEGHKHLSGGLVRHLENGSSHTLAVDAQSGRDGPTLVWFNGFKSDMTGTKASELADWASLIPRAFVRFDYMGHGASGGAFTDGTISLWRDDALAVIDEATKGDLVLAGSSMGAWIATLAALARPARVRALVLVAPALDFTERLMWQSFDAATREAVMEKGVWHRPSPYSPDPYPITRALIEDGRKHLLLDGPIGFSGPVRILQGMADADVPHHHALLTAAQFGDADLRLELVHDGDHRLSRSADLGRLCRMVRDTINLVS